MFKRNPNQEIKRQEQVEAACAEVIGFDISDDEWIPGTPYRKFKRRHGSSVSLERLDSSLTRTILDYISETLLEGFYLSFDDVQGSALYQSGLVFFAFSEKSSFHAHHKIPGVGYNTYTPKGVYVDCRDIPAVIEYILDNLMEYSDVVLNIPEKKEVKEASVNYYAEAMGFVNDIPEVGSDAEEALILWVIENKDDLMVGDNKYEVLGAVHGRVDDNVEHRIKEVLS